MSFTTIFNARLCRNGQLVEEPFVVSQDTGLILPSTGYIGGEALDLEGLIIAPGFIELQTNGLRGFHFTHARPPDAYHQELDSVSRYLASQGVTGFLATLPTVKRDEYMALLPLLKPRPIAGGAALLGAHAEGPYLQPNKKGAHNSDLFTSTDTPPSQVYGQVADGATTLRLVTVAPELPGAIGLTQQLSRAGIKVSLGHSSATFEQGLAAVEAGATCLTHTLNAMAPLHHREPGLAGLAGSQAAPYFSIIPDGNHLHPSVVKMLFRADPSKCIVITDSIELAGLPDGVYPGHAQIPHAQRKAGNRVTIEGTDTLVGGCASLQECVRNLMAWSGCSIAEAVRCATENIVNLLQDTERGKLEAGRRADFVVLNDEGVVLQTWIDGEKVWEKPAGYS